MYFLAKNFRNCSKSIRGSPDKYKLYKNGVLNWEYLAKNISYFLTHPEQIKAKLKEKDAHMLCQFFDSDEYKSRVSQFLEMQGKILSKDTITGIKPPGSVTYQHVLSCAQPSHKKPKMFVDVEADPEAPSGLKIAEERRKRVKRCTIFEELMNRKGRIDMQPDSDCASVKSESKPKRFRQRSTIMPIFLKKIKQKRQQEVYEIEDDAGDSENLSDLTDQTARRLRRVEDEEPLFAQILNRCNVSKSKKPMQPRSASNCNISKLEKSQEAARPQTISALEMRSSTPPYRLQTEESSRLIEMPAAVKLRSASFQPDNMKEPHKVTYRFSSRRNVLEMVGDEAKKPPFASNFSTNIDHKASGNLGLVRSHYKLNKSKSKLGDLAIKLSGPLRMASSTAKMPSKSATTTTTKLYPRKNMNLKSFSDFLCVETVKPLKMKKALEETKSVKIKVLKPEKRQKAKRKKKLPMQLLLEQLQSIRALNVQNNFEKKNTLRQVWRNNEEKRNRSDRAEAQPSSLFNKVKLGTSKSATPDGVNAANPKPISFLDRVILKPRHMDMAKEMKPKPIKDQESFTYKIVSRNRERREAKLRKQFKINPPYWQNNLSVSLAKPSAYQTAKEAEGTSTRNCFFNFEETDQ